MGLICLLNNQLLRNPLSREDVTPRLLGHWGTTPGLNFSYAHLNRVIKGRSEHGDDIPEMLDWVWPDARGARVEAGVGATVATAGDNE